MTKERELLRRALEDWDFSDKVETLDPIFEEIRAYLSNTSNDAEEPVAWIDKHSLEVLLNGTPESRAGAYVGNVVGLKSHSSETRIIPLYLHPPKPAEPEARKPMTVAEIEKRKPAFNLDFLAGIRFAEKHHGITDADV